MMPSTARVDDLRGTVDFAVLTILDEEFTAVLQHFPSRERVEGGLHIYECATIQSVRGTYRVVVVRAARQGYVAMYE